MVGTPSLAKLEAMGSFDCVVVGLDGSPSSSAALGWVSQRVAEDGVLHVVHAFTPSTELVLAAMQIDWVPLRAEAQNNLEGPWTQELGLSGRRFETHLVEDDPADALMRASGRFGAEAIIVGAHGASPGHHRLLGGVTKKLLHHAEIPVIVVQRQAAEHADSPIVACLGFGRAADAVAGWAAAMAERAGRPLILLHVLSNRPFYPKDSPLEALSSHLGTDVALELIQENFDRVIQDIEDRHPDVVVSSSIARGSATEAIMEAGKEAELVVLGNGLSVVIGPRTQHVLTFGDFATAVVPTCATPR